MFEGGEMRRQYGDRHIVETHDSYFSPEEHLRWENGVEIKVADLYDGVKWLGFRWSPFLGKSVLKKSLTEKIKEAEGQLKNIPVSAESTLYLCDAVVWGHVSYKAFLGALSMAEMNDLERPIRQKYLKAAKLPKVFPIIALNLPANVCGLGWTSWYDRLMKNRVAFINKWINSKTTIVGFVLRWALERMQERIASEKPVGIGGDVTVYVAQKMDRVTYWLDQAVAWMES